jgi:hypothetical protein
LFGGQVGSNGGCKEAGFFLIGIQGDCLSKTGVVAGRQDVEGHVEFGELGVEVRRGLGGLVLLGGGWRRVSASAK